MTMGTALNARRRCARIRALVAGAAGFAFALALVASSAHTHRSDDGVRDQCVVCHFASSRPAASVPEIVTLAAPPAAATGIVPPTRRARVARLRVATVGARAPPAS
jgi:hypothetical protein